MAATLTTTITVTWTNGLDQIKAGVSTKTNQTGDKAIQNVQSIGTASEQIVLGDVTGPKTLILKNMEPAGGHTIFIDDTSPATSSSPHKLDPGEVYITHTAADNWYAISIGAAANLDVFAAQD